VLIRAPRRIATGQILDLAYFSALRVSERLSAPPSPLSQAGPAQPVSRYRSALTSGNRNLIQAAGDPSGAQRTTRPVVQDQATPPMAELSRCCRAAAAAASAASFFDLPKPSPSLRSRFHTTALIGVSGLPAIDSYS